MTNTKPSSLSSSPFAKLSDLTNFHLNNTPIGNGSLPSTEHAITLVTAIKCPEVDHSKPDTPNLFNIPKLFGRTGISGVPPTAAAATAQQTPHGMSMQKLLDLKKLNLSAAVDRRPVAAPIVVNLTAAAADTVVRTRSISSSDASANGTEDVDMLLAVTPICHPCDAPTASGHQHAGERSLNPLVALSENLTVECDIDLSALAVRKLPHKTACRSRIGRVLCARYANRAAKAWAAARVRHEFAAGADSVQRYRFEKPSPDDLILRQLAKWKKPAA